MGFASTWAAGTSTLPFCLRDKFRKLTHDKCNGAVLDLKSTVVDQVAMVYAAFDKCIASVPISDCQSLNEGCCESKLFCKFADGTCIPSLDDSALSGNTGCFHHKELRNQDDFDCPQN